MKTLKTLLLICGIATTLSAQEMSMEDLVEEVLQNNLEIEVGRNDFRRTENLAKPGQVGLFPDFVLNGNAGYSRNNTSLEFAGDIPPVEVDGAENLNYGASVGLNYVLFNGFQRRNNLKILESTRDLSQLQVQALSEAYALEAIFAYLDLVALSKNVELAANSLSISKRRLDAVNLAYANGSKTKIDQLSAEIDYNNDSLQLVQRANAVVQRTYDINLLLGRNPLETLTLDKKIPIPASKGADIEQNVMSRNTNLLLSQLALQQSQLQQSLSRGQRSPEVVMNASYGFSTAENGAGIILSQQNQGLSAGLNLAFPIFQGRRIHNALENSKIETRSGQIQLKLAEQNLRSNFFKLQIQESELYQALSIARRNELLSQTAMERAEKAYSFGQIGFTDLRQSQLNLLRSQISRIEAEISLVKIAYQFEQLSGALLK